MYFKKKIKIINIDVCFPEYKGKQNYEEASKYIEDRFVDQNENPNKKVYPHVTCATDTDNMKHVFNAVKNIILQKALGDSGLRF